MNSDSKNVEWYIKDGGRELGVFSYNEVIQMILKQDLSAESTAWSGGMNKWRPLGEIPAFSNFFITHSTNTIQQDVLDRESFQTFTKGKMQWWLNWWFIIVMLLWFPVVGIVLLIMRCFYDRDVAKAKKSGK